MFCGILDILKNKLKKPLPAPAIVEFVMEIKYYYHYNLLKRFCFEDSNYTRYYVGVQNSEGYHVWKNAKKGDTIRITTIEGIPTKVENITHT